MKRILRLAGVAALAFSANAFSRPFPSRPITLICPSSGSGCW